MNPRGFLERLADFERRVRHVYLNLGDRATFPAEVRFFWNCMAEDERHHLAILERSAGLLDLMQSPPQVSEARLNRVEATVAAAETAIGQPEVSSDEAFRQALILEGSELNSLDTAWFQGFRPTLSALLQAMTPEEEIHLRRLVEAVQAFSTDKALQQQATTLWTTYQQQQSGTCKLPPAK
jgi:rubrerythrin